SPLRQYRESLTQEEAHLFTPAPASHTVFRGSFFGGGADTGKNPPAGAVIDYWLKAALKKADGTKPSDSAPGSEAKDASKPDGETAEAPKLTLDILDSAGKVIRHFPKKESEPDADEGFGGPGRGAGPCLRRLVSIASFGISTTRAQEKSRTLPCGAA